MKNIIDAATRQDWYKICDSRLAITLLRHSISFPEHARWRVSGVRHSVRIEQKTIFSIAIVADEHDKHDKHDTRPTIYTKQPFSIVSQLFSNLFSGNI